MICRLCETKLLPERLTPATQVDSRVPGPGLSGAQGQPCETASRGTADAFDGVGS